MVNMTKVTVPEKVGKSVDRMSQGPPFQTLFKNRRYTQKAREYHHEVLHLIIDLIDITIKVNKAAAVCRYHQQSISKPKDYQFDRYGMLDFKELLYHYENYCFRVAAFKDKISQFVNQGLKLGYGEKETNLVQRMSTQQVYKDSLIKTELQKFTINQNLKSFLSRRIQQSHSIYYSDPGCNLYFLPDNTKDFTDEANVKLWSKNLINEVKKVDKTTLAVKDIANKVMEKMSMYLEKNQR